MNTNDEAQQSAPNELQQFDPRWIIARHRIALIDAAPEPWRQQIAVAFDKAYRGEFVLDELIAYALRVLDERDKLRHEVLRTGEVEPTDENKRLAADLYLAPAMLLGAAARLLDAGDVPKAWCVADLAAQIIESFRFKEGERFVASLRGKRGLRERHKDNRADREFVRRWWAEHKDEFQSKDAAAEHITKSKLVNQSFRTVRDWLKGA
jgi:hypothetical protein